MPATHRPTVRRAVLIAVTVLAGGAASPQPSAASRRADLEAVNARMVAAFKHDPAAVAAFYTDAAAIIGGGQRVQGRAALDGYWKEAAMFADWSLETLETGGPADAPWQYGRSVVHGRTGQTMETYFVGLMRRRASGELKFQVDAFTRERGDTGAEDAGRAFDAYLKAVERGDANALGELLDDQFVIVTDTTARGKAAEIADLVPASGAGVEYFRSASTVTRGFGSLAVTSGVLQWKFNGREIERNHTSIAVKRGAGWKILAQQVTPRTGPPPPAVAAVQNAQASRPAATSSADAAGIVEAVAAAVTQRYVVPEAGVKIGAYLRERARQGAYDRLTGGELADALTRDLRQENGDRHLYVQYQPGQAAAPSAGSAAGPVRQIAGAANPDLIRRRNYFLNRAERLDGNIGYLEVRRFFGLTEEALEAAAGAMAFLAQTDAMIIDVRYAPGGDVRMVDMLASYFFDKVTPTLASYSRSRDETIQRSTLEKVPGRRRPGIPVYILVSRDTGSAAEDFAFLMQQTGRGTLVGDRTAGAGNMNAVLGIGGGYSVSVSIGRTFNPKTNQGWEAVGVQPDVRAAAADALDTAHRLALTALMEKAGDRALQQELAWTRDALDARRTPIVADEKTLRSYAGQYGARLVTFADGRLWYQRAAEAERVPMLAVSASEFAMAEGQRLQFVEAGGVMEVRLRNTDGTQVTYKRDR